MARLIWAIARKAVPLIRTATSAISAGEGSAWDDAVAWTDNEPWSD